MGEPLEDFKERERKRQDVTKAKGRNKKSDSGQISHSDLGTPR